MTRQEMRFLRRELINGCLHIGFVYVRAVVRKAELYTYGKELKAYE